MAAENVDLVDEFIYLGSLISHDGGSEAEILRCITIARECFPSSRRTSGGPTYSQTLYRTYILPVMLYGCETRTVSKSWQSASMSSTPGVCGKFYGFRTPDTLQMTQSGASRAACHTNDTVRSITGCLPVSEKVKSFRLRFCGHPARSAPVEDHHRVIAAAL